MAYYISSFSRGLDQIREAVKTLVPARDPLLGGMKFTTTTVFCEAAG